jgi:predicted dehydrogenase
MTQPDNSTPSLTSRRDFLKASGKAAAVSALAGVALPHVHAQGSDQIRIALVGCGGRGSGAADNAMAAKKGSVKLAAMADIFQDRMTTSFNGLKAGPTKDFVEVTNDTKFIGFDAFKQAMDVLKPGDIAIFTTPLAFRWVHYQYAIEKKLNVFMEKPLTSDGPTSRIMLDLAKKADAANLKTAVGLMSRHSRHLQELQKRVSGGEIGDVILMRGYRMHGPVGSMASLPYKVQKLPGADNTELEYQIRRFHSFIWASGGCFSDFYIHHIDHLCWMKNAWPVKAQGNGGRHYKNSPEGAPYVDQNFDNYSVEYTFEDGSKFIFEGRCMVGTEPRYYSFVHGSKGMAVAAADGDYGGSRPSAIYTGQNPVAEKRTWQSKETPDERDPYVNEWRDFLDAIRNNKPYNEVPRGVQASLVTSMGRMACHTGQEITYEQMLNHEHRYAPGADKFTRNSPPPLTSDANGRYPVPMPGIVNDREYGPTSA